MSPGGPERHVANGEIWKKNARLDKICTSWAEKVEEIVCGVRVPLGSEFHFCELLNKFLYDFIYVCNCVKKYFHVQATISVQ